MRLFGYCVVKNESSRYLDACLAWHSQFLDEIVVFDDQSTDNSVEIARHHGCHVAVREDGTPSFLEHEGRFREAAWRKFEELVEPKGDDWVLAFDADEFLVSDVELRLGVEMNIFQAQENDCLSVLLVIPEIFSVEEYEGFLDMPMRRIDGAWRQIQGWRLFAYQPNASYSNKRMASGAEPTYVADAPKNSAKGLWLLHYGYASPEDQQAKYDRYTANPVGHGSVHVQSIVGKKRLGAWTDAVPQVWRGALSLEEINLITVAHNHSFMEKAHELKSELETVHPKNDRFTFEIIDNRVDNRGFAKACNLGALVGTGSIIGFINPDLEVSGPFLQKIRAVLADPEVAVTGSNFGKSSDEYRTYWGCKDWVCGACFFVRRDWWERLGGFDENYVWSWEESDFIRRVQQHGGKVVSLKLPLWHDSPSDDSPRDLKYKEKYFNQGAQFFYRKWR